VTVAGRVAPLAPFKFHLTFKLKTRTFSHWHLLGASCLLAMFAPYAAAECDMSIEPALQSVVSVFVPYCADSCSKSIVIADPSDVSAQEDFRMCRCNCLSEGGCHSSWQNRRDHAPSPSRLPCHRNPSHATLAGRCEPVPKRLSPSRSPQALLFPPTLSRPPPPHPRAPFVRCHV
jgi:hypothetical protein